MSKDEHGFETPKGSSASSWASIHIDKKKIDDWRDGSVVKSSTGCSSGGSELVAV